MWGNPGALNRLSDLLFLAVLVLVLYWAIRFAVQQPVFAMRELRIVGTTTHVTAAQVEAIARRDVHGTFFTLDLALLRSSFEKLPWVRKVDVRRQWPDRIDVTLEEHVPAARWNNTGLVNNYGEVFEAAYDGELPVFVGPDGTAKEIAAQYAYFQRELAVLGHAPVQVQLSSRRAWQVRLDNGMTLQIGREQVQARLTRFLQTYSQTLGKLGRRVDYVDLRYGNGYAARIPELAGEKPGAAKPRPKT